MRRTFFSLYIIVVIGIVVIGWGIDRFYQSVNKTPSVNALDSAFFSLLDKQLNALSLDELSLQLDSIEATTGLILNLYSLEDLADSDLKESISKGELVQLNAQAKAQQYYYRIGQTESVIKVQVPSSLQPNRYLYDGLLLLFYLGIAIVIYVWVWPLARDLRYVEQQARSIGKAGEIETIQLKPSSAVYHVASEFNRMQQRINDLLATYKEMTNAVSHELRTPLARMKFALELAEKTSDPNKQSKQFSSLRKDISEMEELVSQLLNYAGYESQSEALQYHAGDLAALIKQFFLESNNFVDVQEKPHIEYSLEDHLEQAQVYCEWNLMERALHNLLSNAQKYAEKKIAVTLSNKDGFYEVRIEDDGPGIATEDRGRAFESFVRLQSVGSGATKGFGLGLAIVKRIIGWHEGTVSIVDGQLKGACFLLRWPEPVKGQ